MLELNFNPFPVLTTERMILRQKTHADVNEIFFLRSDESVMKYIDRPRAKTLQDATAFIDMITEGINNSETITWAITLKDNPVLIGSIGIWQIQKENYRGELGYVLHPDYQGKGIMSEAVKAVTDFAFNAMNLHSIEANINPENKASAKVLERAGFVQEAYFRENYYYDGRFLDSAIYSLVKPKM